MIAFIEIVAIFSHGSLLGIERLKNGGEKIAHGKTLKTQRNIWLIFFQCVSKKVRQIVSKTNSSQRSCTEKEKGKYKRRYQSAAYLSLFS